MDTIRCDVCGKSQPDVDVCFSRKTTSWYRFYRLLFGGLHEEKLDMCDKCWDEFKDFVKVKKETPNEKA